MSYKVQVVRQLAEEPLPVIVAEEDVGAAAPAVGNVIEGVGKVDAWRAGHGARITSITINCNLNSKQYKPDPAPASCAPVRVMLKYAQPWVLSCTSTKPVE